MNPLSPEPPASRSLSLPLALAWGILLTLCVTGYTFGQSNHHVYLLDAVRFEHPELLRRDWFVMNTLQYHYLFTLLTVGLAKLRLLQAGFFTLYLALVVGMHLAWWSITRSLGGDARTYVLSVLFYHLSAGGLGLGVYQILQDGSFLPSNVAAVATLGAMACWLRGMPEEVLSAEYGVRSEETNPARPIDSSLRTRHSALGTSLCVALAGLFHVNYAMACVGAWIGLTAFAMVRERAVARFFTAKNLLLAAIALGPCLYTIVVTALAARGQHAVIPMSEFFAVYVHLRHSHHHEPLSWPAALWISFLWPAPLALYALWIMPKTRVVQGTIVVLLTLLALQLIAVVFAGIWYVSQTLVMLSLFRFSPFAKLLTCVLAAWLIGQRWRNARPLVPIVCAIAGIGLLVALAYRSHWPTSVPAPSAGLLLGAGLLTLWLGVERLAGRPAARTALATVLLIGLPVGIAFASQQRLGVAMPDENDTEMAEVCDWVRLNTPPDSLFLVPPHDMSFVLAAQRAEVVSFKHVPQLSDELVEWRHRLDVVLDMDVATLPTPMPRTVAAMADRYAALSPAHLYAVARAYGCEYLITMAPLPDQTPLHVSPGHRYFVYAMPTGR